MLLLAEERVAQCGFAAMWGRLLTCGRLLIGLPGIRKNVWLRRCRSAGRQSCLTIRRDSQRNEDLVVQALACARSIVSRAASTSSQSDTAVSSALPPETERYPSQRNRDARKTRATPPAD